MMLALTTLISAVCLTQVMADSAANGVEISNEDPLIFYHGRWDRAPGTWCEYIDWFKFDPPQRYQQHKEERKVIGAKNHFTRLARQSYEFGVHSSEFGAYNVPMLPYGHVTDTRSPRKGAKLLPYTPSKLAFQVIGDSLSAGQYLEQGVLQAWPALTAEFFKSEVNVNAQPGAALTDIPAFGNVHGVSYEFFRTEDTGYYYTAAHNYTTPWDFSRDKPAPTHVVIHIGANDASQNVTSSDFEQTYLNFVTRLRTLYHSQPILVFTPWGWPNPDGTVSQYYEGSYQKIVEERHLFGDKNVFLVNTTGWVTYADIFPDNSHPTEAGHAKIAKLFEAWLQNWGLHPEASWPTEI
ncbi:hypothetical protein EW026_g486 [Hermanssonia centrifuga]|uniref:SGNH hydrolase-type esterase domain-containing protein n=1 Tax=Hermanssonia centrifuga TaxID=98765 RepID=A0A4S4KW93_9APHY|nr:hypothetical protein EW026_g486 [Hermanssonia centrifuga]